MEISKKFEIKNPGAHVVLNGASSGELAAQIENGAPVDVFLSANDKEMQSLKQHGLITGKVRTFTYNRLVVAVPISAKAVKSMDDLSSMKRIAIGTANTVPAGRYAEQALSAIRLLKPLRDNHVFIYGQNARALITYVEQGNVDAAFVYYTDYVASQKVGAAYMVPKKLTDPIAYEIAGISKSKHSKLAELFIEFASSEASNADLLKYHFEKDWN